MARKFSLSRWFKRMGAGMLAMYALAALAIAAIVGLVGVGLSRLLNAAPASDGVSPPATGTTPAPGRTAPWTPPEWIPEVPNYLRDAREWWFDLLTGK